ncbi:hypothetical protein [Streptomyces lydicus]|uniref:hypothetical protein n=1 Tax=Streptomyces lydicus TaxID=47763 RepID=UPI00378E188B
MTQAVLEESTKSVRQLLITGRMTTFGEVAAFVTGMDAAEFRVTASRSECSEAIRVKPTDSEQGEVVK